MPLLLLTTMLSIYSSATYYTKYERRYRKLDLDTLVPTTQIPSSRLIGPLAILTSSKGSSKRSLKVSSKNKSTKTYKAELVTSAYYALLVRSPISLYILQLLCYILINLRLLALLYRCSNRLQLIQLVQRKKVSLIALVGTLAIQIRVTIYIVSILQTIRRSIILRVMLVISTTTKTITRLIIVDRYIVVVPSIDL